MTRANGDYSVLGWIDFSSEHREKVKTGYDAAILVPCEFTAHSAAAAAELEH